jgi:hypothetical protein
VRSPSGRAIAIAIADVARVPYTKGRAPKESSTGFHIDVHTKLHPNFARGRGRRVEQHPRDQEGDADGR